MPTQSTLQPGSASAVSPPSSSAASTTSQNGSKSPSSRATTVLGTSPPSMKERATPTPNPTKKSTMSSIFTGMFGRRDNAESSKAARDKSGDKVGESAKEVGSQEKSPAAPASNASTSPPPSPCNTATSDATAADRKLDDNKQQKRFHLTNDSNGHHEHCLKVAKRHQKIRDMVRNLYRKKEGPGGHEEQPLALVNDWIKQKQAEKATPDLKGGPDQTQTLVQKWGKCQDIVGHGAFGIVRMASKTDPNDPKPQLVAVKEFHKRPGESSKSYQKRVNAEFCLLVSLQHPNVIQVLDLMPDAKGDYCEVMEYCAGGDLYTLILSAGHLEMLEADCYFKQLMRGVEYMHEMGVAHRDLKPENLLLTSHGALKITDFGNGECFRMAWEREAHMTAGLCGSGPYIAPEEYVEKEFDPRKVDVWACGIIYMAMRTGRHLWRVAQKGEDEFFTRYLEDRKEESGFRPIEVLRRRQCRNVIYSVLDPNPARRLTASQALRSEWASQIKVCRAGEEGV